MVVFPGGCKLEYKVLWYSFYSQPLMVTDIVIMHSFVYMEALGWCISAVTVVYVLPLFFIRKTLIRSGNLNSFHFCLLTKKVMIRSGNLNAIHFCLLIKKVLIHSGNLNAFRFRLLTKRVLIHSGNWNAIHFLFI
jgi:hypothetical protein